MGLVMGRSWASSTLAGFNSKTETKPYPPPPISLFNQLLLSTTLYLPDPELEKETNQT